MRYLVVAALLVLSACEHVTVQDDRQCLSYGFVRGTDGYGQCRLALDQQRQNSMALGLAYLGAAQPIGPYTIANPTVTCTQWQGMVTCR